MDDANFAGRKWLPEPKETVYQALERKLGRAPTNDECTREVKRILGFTDCRTSLEIAMERK